MKGGHHPMCLSSAKTKHTNKIGVSKKPLLVWCVNLLTFELIEMFIFRWSPRVAELVVCCVPYECFPVLSCRSIWYCQLCHYQLAQHVLCVFPESRPLLWKYAVTWQNHLTYDVTYSANVAFILRVLDKAYFFIFCIAFFPHWFFPLLSLWIVPCSIPSIVLANCWMRFSFSSIVVLLVRLPCH
jgi:hypothetical protein